MKQFGFPSGEKIKAKKEISSVFERGKTLYSVNNKLKAKYLILDTDKGGSKAAFAVFKKSGIAVWRNRVKRLLREAYRLNKNNLIVECEKNNKLLLIVFTLNSVNRKSHPKIKFADLEEDLVSLINKVAAKI